MYFPRPYPDEVIGSLIARACIHLGKRPIKLPGNIASCQSSSRAFYLPSNSTLLARLTGFAAQHLLDKHTVLPYACAFMPQSEVTRITEKILAAKGYDREIVPSSLVKPLPPNNKAFRCCARCIEEDTREFGESYWHRSHQLPCIYLCPIHQEPLLQVNSVGGTPSRSVFSCETPALKSMVPAISPIPPQLMKTLAEFTLGTLAPDWQLREDWMGLYREQAVVKGYHLANDALAGRQMAIDLQHFYGAQVLQFLSCPIGKRLTAMWPALMLRRMATSVGPFSPLKHILLIAFLTHCETRTAKPEYRPRGTAAGNYAEKDELCVRHIQKCWDKAKRQGIRLKTGQMLEASGLYGSYRHNTELFPKTVALLKEFQASSQAAWQVGCRPRQRKRSSAGKRKRPQSVREPGSPSG